MGLLDNLKHKMKGDAPKHGDKVDQGIDKTSEAADSKTGGKHGEQIDTGSTKAKESFDRYSEKDEGGSQGG